MPRFKDRTNDRYGRLTVIEHAGKNNKNKHLWRCLCDCGNEKIVSSNNLSSGKSKSCGCLKKEFLARSGNQYGLYEDREEAILKVQYSHLKRRHKNFDGTILPFEHFVKKSKSPCKYCGLEYSRELEDRLNETKTGKRLSDTIVKINGIDRLDPSIGYTEENTVSCCKICNFAKHTMTENDFFDWIKKVHIHLFE